ncbi:MAG: hypothetical protein ACREM2_04750 [Vulcanimicrobiaceae bacterium]
MDVATIDQAYQQLQGEAKETADKIAALAAKLGTAAQGGDANAREWMLDLKEIALAVRDEESQVTALLGAMHGFAANALSAPQSLPATTPQGPQPAYAPPPPGYGAPPPGYGQPGYGYGAAGGSPLSGFLQSGFGRAITLGLGFGLGDDLINKIF